MHELFALQAEAHGERVALVYEGAAVSYGELNRRANQLGHYLSGVGVGPETLVGVCLERSVEMVVALLGILKAGGAYVPLDPEYPEARLSFMVQDAGIGVLLSKEELLPRLPPEMLAGSGVVVLELEREWAKVEQCSAEEVHSGVSAEDLAYVMYTSGSTGQPKGAMNTHKGILNRLQWMQNEYQLDENDCVLQKTPYSFDVSVWESFWPLITGSRLAVAIPGGHRVGTIAAWRAAGSDAQRGGLAARDQ